MTRTVDHLPAGATEGFSVLGDLPIGRTGIVHIAPDLVVEDGFLGRRACEQLVAYARENRSRTARMTERSISHFDGRVLYVDALPPSPAREQAFDAARMIADRAMETIGQGHRIEPECPHLVWWPSDPPGGMGWHPDNLVPSRTFTGLIYLNDDYEGGYTGFRDHRLRCPPRTGRATIYKGSTVHGVEDVTAGDRYTLAVFCTNPAGGQR